MSNRALIGSAALLVSLTAFSALARDQASVVEVPAHQPNLDLYHFVDAYRAGGMLYVSGQVGLSRTRPNDAESQYERAFQAVGQVLAAAGLDWGDVVEITTLMVEPQKNFDTISRVKDRYVQAPYPAWTVVGVSELVAPGALVEIRVIAKERDSALR